MLLFCRDPSSSSSSQCQSHHILLGGWQKFVVQRARDGNHEAAVDESSPNTRVDFRHAIARHPHQYLERHTAKQLKEANFNAEELLKVGYTWKELDYAGFQGYSLKKLHDDMNKEDQPLTEDWGFSWKDLHKERVAGYSPVDLRKKYKKKANELRGTCFCHAVFQLD